MGDDGGSLPSWPHRRLLSPAPEHGVAFILAPWARSAPPWFGFLSRPSGPHCSRFGCLPQVLRLSSLVPLAQHTREAGLDVSSDLGLASRYRAGQAVLRSATHDACLWLLWAVTLALPALDLCAPFPVVLCSFLTPGGTRRQAQSLFLPPHLEQLFLPHLGERCSPSWHWLICHWLPLLSYLLMC